MSYEVWGDDGAGDDSMTPEQALELGWISEDVVERIRALLKHVEFETRPGSKHDAALILIDHEINPPTADKPEDPTVTWAKHLMKDVT